MGSTRKNIIVRFWQKVEIGGENDCWIWKGSKGGQGYGEFVLHDNLTFGRFKVQAHRMCLLLMGQNVADEHHVHHHCGRKDCVNPRHLAEVSTGEHADAHRYWTEERVVHAIQSFAVTYGVPPAATDWNISQARRLGHSERVQRYIENRWPPHVTVQRVFGSWANALVAAGFERPGRGRRPKHLELSRSVR